MKVLFVASNPKNAGSLDLQVEINALQTKFMSESVEPISFAFLPSLEVEKLPGVLRNFDPDILHVSAHASDQVLSLADQRGVEVVLDAEGLGSFLPRKSQLRLVYLNACNSREIAKSLTEFVPMAIGTTEVITNQSASASAVTFYDSLLEGSDVQSAFNVMKQMLKTLTGSKVSAELCSRTDVKPVTEILHLRPLLVADFKDAKPKASRGEYSFQLGLLNCPPATTQIVFTTDNGLLISRTMSLQDSLCLVVRPQERVQEVWSAYGNFWTVDRDHRLFATGIKMEGRPYIVSATLCEAVESWYRHRWGKVPSNITMVLKSLRENYI